jgi:hypothetical protein
MKLKNHQNFNKNNLKHSLMGMWSIVKKNLDLFKDMQSAHIQGYIVQQTTIEYV